MEMLDYKKIQNEEEYALYGKNNGRLLPLMPLHLKKINHLEVKTFEDDDDEMNGFTGGVDRYSYSKWERMMIKDKNL